MKNENYHQPKKLLDCQKKSPFQHLKKYLEKSWENMHTDAGV